MVAFCPVAFCPLAFCPSGILSGTRICRVNQTADSCIRVAIVVSSLHRLHNRVSLLNSDRAIALADLRCDMHIKSDNSIHC